MRIQPISATTVRALRAFVVILLCIGTLMGQTALAQNQGVVAEDSEPAPADPLREAALSDELIDLAESPLPALKKARDELAPVFSFIEEIPVEVVEQGGFKFRRGRIRLTMKAREAKDAPFRILRDFEASPESYWGQPLVLHGYLSDLKPLPMKGDGGREQVWHEGQLKLWNDDKSVRFVTQRLPQGMPHDESGRVPASVIGYVFSLSSEEGQPPTPLLVARWIRLMQPTLDLQTLAGVRDRRIGLPEEEADAYYRTLLHAKLIGDDVLEEQAEKFWTDRQRQLKRPRPLFVDLFKTFEEDPEIYRGQAVTLTGTLRKLRRITVDPLNDYGIETLYEGWLFDQDSQSNPTVVVFTENPADLPEGDEISVPVVVTGYVFKMYGYESRDEKHPLRLAPMLLAKSVKKLIVVDSTPFPIAWVGGAIAVLCLGLVLYAWFSNRQNKQLREAIYKPEEEEPPRFDNLKLE